MLLEHISPFYLYLVGIGLNIKELNKKHYSIIYLLWMK